MLPNDEQIKSAIRWLVASFGGMIAGFFAAKGWFTVDQVLSVLNSNTFIGLIVSLVGLVWSVVARTKTNMVLAVNALPEVKGVVTMPTTAGAALATSIPSSTVVTAGTQGAADVAKST